jgi:hypothetical protein
MCEKKISTLQSSWKWDWAILTHGNGRYCYYKHIIFCTEIERCQPFFPAAGFGASMEFHPLGQPSREDESTPRERFLNFTLRVWLWKPEYTYVYIYTPYISYIYIYIYIYICIYSHYKSNSHVSTRWWGVSNAHLMSRVALMLAASKTWPRKTTWHCFDNKLLRMVVAWWAKTFPWPVKGPKKHVGVTSNSILSPPPPCIRGPDGPSLVTESGGHGIYCRGRATPPLLLFEGSAHDGKNLSCS